MGLHSTAGTGQGPPSILWTEQGPPSIFFLLKQHSSEQILLFCFPGQNPHSWYHLGAPAPCYWCFSVPGETDRASLKVLVLPILCVECDSASSLLQPVGI